ncbi:MAG: hypothetical protein MN733_30775 [Nitrososphaera sp.]|nr:hypothetical protein [Nitrososphaera sp.]
MSEIDDSAAVLELESLAQKILKSKGESMKSRRESPAKDNYESPPVLQEVQPQLEKPSLPEKPPLTQKTIIKQKRVIKKRQPTEIKLIHAALKEQEKRNRDDLKKWMEKLSKSHESQINRMRADYINQNAGLRNDLKDLLEGQGKDLKESCTEVLSNANQEELERLANWFHDEFIKELDNKSRQFEELKTSSETQVNKMV